MGPADEIKTDFASEFLTKLWRFPCGAILRIFCCVIRIEGWGMSISISWGGRHLPMLDEKVYRAYSERMMRRRLRWDAGSVFLSACLPVVSPD
jgi:hypothetical protein